MNSILSNAQPGGRPPAAVELSPEGVLAAALPAPGQPPVYAFQPLAPGALLPGIGEPNLRAPEAIATAIRTALGQLSTRSRYVTLVLPDTVVRVFVLDFDSLPSKPAEAYPVLRFRLRKMVPFDVEHAGLSYQVLTESKSEIKVLAAVIPSPILAEYEAAVRAAGYEPGAVLPSSLAALAITDLSESLEAILVANLTAQSLTTAVTNGNDLLLYRTLDLPTDPSLHRQEVQRGIAVAAAYYEDKLGAKPTHLYLTGNYGADYHTPENDQIIGSIGRAEAFARWIDETELTFVDLTPRPETGVVTSLGNNSIAGVTGALAGAR